MGERLPAVPARVDIEPTTSRRAARPATRRWLSSPLADAIVDLAPDVLRLAGRASRAAAPPSSAPGLPPSGANGLTVSEVEIDVASPFVRRIVVRSTNAWSVAPEVALASKRGRGSRIGLGALSLISLALLGAAAVRRSPLALPDRRRGD